MLELLVSMVVGALIALALTNFFARNCEYRASAKMSKRARTILSELPNMRAPGVEYSFLVDKMGNHTVLINRAMASETGSNLEKSVSAASPLPPALMDYVNLDWDDKAKKEDSPKATRHCSRTSQDLLPE
ncbi:MAG: hypothetical protein IPM23_11720 [Candidatus Melainabacteria bacterium]|nr:hypothetical protein [Candidatus Melainabacteria bacterium]